MNRIRSDLSARQATLFPPERDIAHEVGMVLHAMIVIFAILLVTVLSGAAIGSLAHWIALN
jgi:hypothetical protein